MKVISATAATSSELDRFTSDMASADMGAVIASSADVAAADLAAADVAADDAVANEVIAMVESLFGGVDGNASNMTTSDMASVIGSANVTTADVAHSIVIPAIVATSAATLNNGAVNITAADGASTDTLASNLA